MSNYALYGCVELESIELPPLIKEIGEYAFGMCTFLTSVIYNGMYAFTDNTVFHNHNSSIKVYVLDTYRHQRFCGIKVTKKAINESLPPELLIAIVAGSLAVILCVVWLACYIKKINKIKEKAHKELMLDY